MEFLRSISFILITFLLVSFVCVSYSLPSTALITQLNLISLTF
jgi:hypothetical protein